jgi:hypothetical protein
MNHRILRLASSTLVVGALAATPALATDDPPSSAPLQPAPPLSALAPVLGKCKDTTRPASSVAAKAARSAIKSRVLRGTSRDVGCGVAMVTVSFARQQRGHCQFLTTKRKLSRPTPCSGHFLVANGTKSWRLALPSRLPHGTYVVRTRAIDFAGNVESRQAHGRRLRVR